MRQWDGKSGYIVTITGPMFSEKSGELIKECINLELFGNKKYKGFKPENDNRFSETKIVSRMKMKTETGETVNLSMPAENLPQEITDEIFEKVCSYMNDYDVFAFDEAQFFRGKIVELILELCYNGKMVIIAGLNTTYEGLPFGKIGDLMAISHENINKVAYCRRCKCPATQTQRLQNGEPAPLGEVEVVGDAESYEPRCVNCYVPPNKVK